MIRPPVFAVVGLAAFVSWGQTSQISGTSGSDGNRQVRLITSIHGAVGAPGEDVRIEATLEILAEGPLQLPSNNHQPLGFLFLKTPSGDVFVHGERGTSPVSSRPLGITDYSRPISLKAGNTWQAVWYDVPLVDPSPNWLDAETYKPARPNFRVEGAYEAWARYEVPKIEGAPTAAWHGVVESERVRFTVRDVPVADRRTDPTPEQLAHLQAFIHGMEAKLSPRELERQAPERVEMPQAALIDRLRWAFMQVENEGLARHAVALLREHMPAEDGEAYPRWWPSVYNCVRSRAILPVIRRERSLRILGPYLDDYAALAVDKFERDFRNFRSGLAAPDSDFILAYLKHAPESAFKSRVEAIALGHAKLVGDSIPHASDETALKLGLAWHVLFTFEILHDGMAYAEAIDLLGKPTSRQGDVVEWSVDTGSRGGPTQIDGKLIGDKGRETIDFTNHKR